MNPYSIQKKWKYLFPIAAAIPDKLLKFIAQIFTKLQKRTLIGDKMPKKIVLFVTKKCNLRCKHCFYTPHVSQAQEMSLSQIKLLACSVKNNLKQLILTGGEPFMRDDFSDIVFSFIENGCEMINIDTNGILVEKIDTFLKKILKESEVRLSFQISLDGPPSVHDYIRGLPGASEKVFQTLALLSDYYQKYPTRFGNISVATSINRLNLSSLPETIDQTKSLKNITHVFNFTRSANLHTFKTTQNHLSGFDVNKDIILNIDEMKKTFEYLEDKIWEKKNISLVTLVNRQIMIEVIRLLERRTSNFACFAGKTEAVIYPEGDVGVCEMLKSVGNLKETGYDLIKFYERHEKNFRIVPKCICTHDCNIATSIRLSPQSLIDMVKRKKYGENNFN